MGESTGSIVFINSHDYVSDVDGTAAVGCLSVLRTENGKDVTVYTDSIRLQHTLEMAYATARKVTVDYFAQELPLNEQQRLMTTSSATGQAAGLTGPFRLKAIWTLE